VATPEGLTIHYFYDPPLANTSHNKSVSGAITTDVSICAIIYKDEIYDHKRSRQWTLDAPIFGVTFGAKNISVHIELPDNYPVRPEAYRQFLRYCEAEQQQVTAKDFADDALKYRPAWLIDLINSLAPADSSSTNDIRDELQRLLNSVRIKTQGPRSSSTGDISVDAGPGAGARPDWDGEVPRDGKTPRVNASDLIAVPTGAKRATISLNAERAPQIIPLHDEAQIEEKGLKGKAARFYPEASQLFVNMLYPAVDEMRRQLELEYASAPDPDWMRQLALNLAERTIIIRVGRAVIYALAKQLNREWTAEDMTRAHSPESLSLAADDYVDALQNVRRRMGRELRTPKQEVVDTIQAV
jgi:hypothetical protein